MSSNNVLSGEQALDDYFNALLGEEMTLTEDDQSLNVVESVSSSVEPEPEPEPEPEVQLQYAEPARYPLQVPPPELEAPNLEDVQRLLSQLESTNVVAELGIDDIFHQNTIDIAPETKPAEPDVVSLVDVEECNDEIQDWVIEEPAVATISTQVADLEPVKEQEINTEQHTEAELEAQVELETQAGSEIPIGWESTARNTDFQVLYFDVNNVTFAVPLDELGGIHRISELNHLIGKPAWYLGLQTSREQKFDVVDTAKWVMADKLLDEHYKESYQYVVMLGESMWGLASHQLMGTETLNVDKVRWRELPGKRPWLAGMVKEKMCALIHVQALIDMLNAGLDVKSMN